MRRREPRPPPHRVAWVRRPRSASSLSGSHYIVCRAAHALDSFPSEAALAELRATRVTHVLVHTPQFTRRYGEKALAAIDTITQLQFETEDEGIRLYRLK